jgi:hypothetical protein
MTSSPTSASDSSSSPNHSPTLAKFDPFAVHPFTNCSASQSDNHPHNRQFPTYGYPHGPSLGNYHSLHSPTPQQQVPPAINKSSTESSVNAYALPHRPAIFIPFRQDNSSPELPDILKANKSLSKSSTTKSDSRTLSNISYQNATGNTTQPTPNSYSYPRKS